MSQRIALVAITVADYDEALAFYVDKLGFELVEDFWRDYRRLQQCGVKFVRPPREETYGTVAVFEDLYGNLLDLIQPGVNRSS